MTLTRPLGIVFLFGLMLLLAVPGHAADGNNRFALKGAGFLPCSVFVSEREKRSNVYFMIGGWIEGYVSAHNKLTPNTYDVMSFENLELLLSVIDHHCKSRPGDRLYPVLNTLLTQLWPDRIKSEDSRIRITEGKRQAQLYRETVQRMQVKLTELGLYKGPVDGRYTEATQSAIIAFQSDQSLAETGFPDQTTLWRLFRKKPSN